MSNIIEHLRIPFLGYFDWLVGTAICRESTLIFKITLDKQFCQTLPSDDITVYDEGTCSFNGVDCTSDEFQTLIDGSFGLVFSMSHFLFRLMQLCHGTSFMVSASGQDVEIAIGNISEPIREPTPFIVDLAAKLEKWMRLHVAQSG